MMLVMLAVLRAAGPLSGGLLVAFIAMLLIPASDVAVSILNQLLTAFLPDLDRPATVRAPEAPTL